MSEKARTSRIKKSIRRVYKVADFETLELIVDYEDDLAWDTPEERQEKCDGMTKLLLDDFCKTRQDVFEELSVSEKKAYFRNLLKSMKADLSDVSDEELLK